MTDEAQAARDQQMFMESETIEKIVKLRDARKAGNKAKPLVTQIKAYLTEYAGEGEELWDGEHGVGVTLETTPGNYTLDFSGLDADLIMYGLEEGVFKLSLTAKMWTAWKDSTAPKHIEVVARTAKHVHQGEKVEVKILTKGKDK